jgi:hypothetical protein
MYFRSIQPKFFLVVLYAREFVRFAKDILRVDQG